MVIGTGIDIIEIERIERAIKRWGKSFLNHVFLKEEIAYAKKYKRPAQHFAARLAAKEAVFKAIGDNPKITWKDLKITNDKHGRPHCVFNDKKFKHKISISISHSDHYAVASAIIEK
ncbi:MAG TPA: holo-ACP synthase [Candidatus Omnitrophota bacterium]|nr:holo-ACP synthase [Candidatus Omnitrophota bacterium]